MSGRVPAPEELPTADVTLLSSLLLRTLELHSAKHLERLSRECQDAIVSLPEEDRPSTYEGLLDVARYCIDDVPSWNNEDKAVLIGGHPRIGAKRGNISSSSQAEQRVDVVDDESDAKLAKLNFIYEQRFPTLRYVTFVAGRPRSAIATELKELLGSEMAGLPPPPQPIVDPDEAPASVKTWAKKKIKPFPSSSQEWQDELVRGLDALFEIAMNRASKITPDDYKEQVSGPETKNSTEDETFDTPFVTLDRFSTLVESSPLLSTFFRVDLPSSFYLVPPPPPQETPRELLATLAAVAVTGGGGGDATRKRVKGLLGGLWGEVTDRAGKVTGRETRTGPRPAFGREERLRGEEMKAKGSKTGKLSSTGTDIENAEENLKLATQRLTDMDRSHFVIDEPTIDASREQGEDEEGEEEDLEIGMDRLGIDGGSEVQSGSRGQEAEIAKDLRSALPA